VVVGYRSLIYPRTRGAIGFKKTDKLCTSTPQSNGFKLVLVAVNPSHNAVAREAITLVSISEVYLGSRPFTKKSPLGCATSLEGVKNYVHVHLKVFESYRFAAKTGQF
jgi:DNA polymerase II small subunit/DNA polymerase delta subunit B